MSVGGCFKRFERGHHILGGSRFLTASGQVCLAVNIEQKQPLFCPVKLTFCHVS
jgi:hypothetical protein